MNRIRCEVEYFPARNIEGGWPHWLFFYAKYRWRSKAYRTLTVCGVTVTFTVWGGAR